ncbi:hypothetical protein C7S15_4685 [Burkholderia cepacia]|nr:hypothetical protein [Burkholderia cepacia]
MHESIGHNDRSTITNPHTSIDGFPLRFIACRSAMVDAVSGAANCHLMPVVPA